MARAIDILITSDPNFALYLNLRLNAPRRIQLEFISGSSEKISEPIGVEIPKEEAMHQIPRKWDINSCHSNEVERDETKGDIKSSSHQRHGSL